MANNLVIDSVRDLGMQFVNNPHKMVGQDGAYSIPLNGETLWFFGDTLIGRRTPGESLWYIDNQPVGPRDMSGMGLIEKMINNTGLLLPGQDAANGLQKFKYIFLIMMIFILSFTIVSATTHTMVGEQYYNFTSKSRRR